MLDRFDLGRESGSGGVHEAERFDRHRDVGGQDLDDVVDGGIGIVDAGEELQQRDLVGGNGSGGNDGGSGEEEALEVVGARKFRFTVVVPVLDPFDDDEPTGGMVDPDPSLQRLAVGEAEVVLDDPGEVEQRLEMWAVGEIVECDPEPLPDQTGEPVTHGLGRFDVLEDFQDDAVGGDRRQELGLGHVVGGQVHERPSLADQGVQADLGDRVHQHSCRGGVTVDELGGPSRGAVTEQQLVADRVQRPIQDGLATDEQGALFIIARGCSHCTAAR